MIVCPGRENPLHKQSLEHKRLKFFMPISVGRMSAEYGYELNKPSRLFMYGFSTSARHLGGFCFYVTK